MFRIILAAGLCGLLPMLLFRPNDGSQLRKGIHRTLAPLPSYPGEFRSCQRKVEMSGFPPDRIVRFHGLLQGCSAGTWYLGLLWFLGFGVRSASPGGRRPEGLAERCAG